MPFVLYRTGGGSLIAGFDYDTLRASTSWDAARRELGLADHAPVNIGRMCSDRIVEQGQGGKIALIHENHDGEVRPFTFRDLSVLTNGWADVPGQAGGEAAGPRLPVPRPRCPSSTSASWAS